MPYAYEPRLSAEEMLAELEKLDETIEHKLARPGVPAETKKRFEEELRPRLEECRALVARRGTRARNACQDVLVAYRELAFTALATITTPNF